MEHHPPNIKKRLEIPTNGWFGLVYFPRETKGIFFQIPCLFFFGGGKYLRMVHRVFFYHPVSWGLRILQTTTGPWYINLISKSDYHATHVSPSSSSSSSSSTSPSPLFLKHFIGHVLLLFILFVIIIFIFFIFTRRFHLGGMGTSTGFDATGSG